MVDINNKIKQKKVDIFSLYQNEKKIRIDDDQGNYVEFIIVKMTQGQRLKTLNAYNEYLEEQRLRLREREDKFHTLALAVERYKTEDFITGIVALDAARRLEISDLYPNLDKKNDEEKEKIISEELENFRRKCTEELMKESRENLKKRFVDVTLESQAMLDSARILNYTSLIYMCLDVETRKPIFNSVDDVEKVRDRRVIDRLIEEMSIFRTTELPKETRAIASGDQTFLANGESQKN